MTRSRIVFFGYSEIGYECLTLLLGRGDNVVALLTHEDNPAEKIWFKTPAMAAREQGVPIYTPATVNTPEWIESSGGSTTAGGAATAAFARRENIDVLGS